MPTSKKLMNIFTKGEASKPLGSMAGTTAILDSKEQEQILRNIAFGGTATETVKPIIGGNLSKILSLSSGLPRIQTNVIKRFALIVSQPEAISILNPFEIRCCLCREVIRYPAWYYNIKYAINHFHYFICFDSSSPDKPSCKCYRRSE